MKTAHRDLVYASETAPVLIASPSVRPAGAYRAERRLYG